MKINISQLSEELQRGLTELSGVLRFTIAPEGLLLQATRETANTEDANTSNVHTGDVSTGISNTEDVHTGISKDVHTGFIKIEYKENKCIVTYQKQVQFYKAFAHILRNETAPITLTPAFSDLETMVDCSRNAVLSVEGAKKLIRYLAVMGFEALQLYTEDTLMIPEYPYAGHMRGRYSPEEIMAIREYCDLFGIELIPCIQTLAHLGQTLRWSAHKDMLDIDNILLIDEEKTYDFIESLVRQCRKMFTTDRINIGMDEAYQVGMGKYLQKHGYTDRSMLMVKHLRRVVDICQKYGYKPMMWSDMFFYLQFKGDYYVAEGNFSDEVKQAIPKELTLIYWDYYSCDPKRYDKMFGMHRDLHDKIGFAGGAWRWMGAVPNNGFSLKAVDVALTAAVRAKVPQVIATLWGDDGGEASVLSVMPTLQLYSDMNYYGDRTRLKDNFMITTGVEFDEFMLIDGPQALPGYDNSAPWSNPAKYMLFQDVLMGLFDLHIKEKLDADHLRQVAQQTSKFLETLPEASPWKNLFRAHEALCIVLSHKCDMGLRIRKNYAARDREGLQQIATREIPALIADIRSYYQHFRTLWLEYNKVFGLEIQDIRYGGLMMRLESAGGRLTDYLEGRVPNLPELEQELLPYSELGQPGTDNCYTSEGYWRKIVSSCPVSGY